MKERADRERHWLQNAKRTIAKTLSRATERPADDETATSEFGRPRNDWTRSEIRQLFTTPFADLIIEAQLIHRTHHDSAHTEIGALQRLIEHRSAQIRNHSLQLGAIIDMRRGRDQRIVALHRLATLSQHAREISVSAASLARAGFRSFSDLQQAGEFDGLELARTIAVARIIMPMSKIRLASNRSRMSEALHTLCFLAGANLIFFSDDPLTTRRETANVFRRLFCPARTRRGRRR